MPSPGSAETPGGVGQATRWRLRDGVRGPRLGAPEALVAPADGTGFSQGFAIDGQRRVVGEYAVGADFRAALWSREGFPTALDSLGRRFARANDIAGGVTVGHVSIDAATGWVLHSVEGRNAAGEMVGFGTRNGQNRSVPAGPCRTDAPVRGAPGTSCKRAIHPEYRWFRLVRSSTTGSSGRVSDQRATRPSPPAAARIGVR